MNMREFESPANGRGKNLVGNRGPRYNPHTQVGGSNFQDTLWGKRHDCPRTLVPPFPCKCVFCNHPYYRQTTKGDKRS